MALPNIHSQWQLLDLKNNSGSILATNCLIIQPSGETANQKFMLLGGNYNINDSSRDEAFEVEILEDEEYGPTAVLSMAEYLNW